MIACIVIAGGKRRDLIDRKILPSILPQGFDDVLVVGDHHAGEIYKYLYVPDMMKNTNDALIKRDVGTLATSADILVYLSDDHALHWDFLNQLRPLTSGAWDVLMPDRYTTAGVLTVPLNMGQTPALPSCGDPRQAIAIAPEVWGRGVQVDYLAGHAGVFRRSVVMAQPWTTMKHDRLWDVWATRVQMENGARFVFAPQLKVEDLEPEAQPWR